MSLGNPGDSAPVGEGVSEMRIHYGPGYRVYFVQRGSTVTLLCGGDKSSQTADIKAAKQLAKRESRKRWRALSMLPNTSIRRKRSPSI
jgi:putative addiction module killer protein